VGGWGGQIVFSRPSADSFAVGRRQKLVALRKRDGAKSGFLEVSKVDFFDRAHGSPQWLPSCFLRPYCDLVNEATELDAVQTENKYLKKRCDYLSRFANICYPAESKKHFPGPAPQDQYPCKQCSKKYNSRASRDNP
jgi:hypothetical protein